MGELLTFQFVAPLLAGLFSLTMGLAVLRVEPKNVTYQYYFAIMLAVAVWSLFVALFHVPEVAHDTWTLLHWAAGFFIAPAYLLFLVTFPASHHVVKTPVRILLWAGAGVMAAAVLLWPEKFVQYISVNIHEVPEISVGPYAWILDVYFPLYFVPGFFFAGRKFFKAIGRTRAHILTGLVGLAIASTGALITNVSLAIHAGREFIWLGPIFAAIAPASIAYMLFGMREGKPRLFPVLGLGLLVLGALAYLTITSATIEEVILHGIILVAVILLSIFLVRTSLIESADARRFQDISHRLQRANEDLKQADRVKTEFLNIVSHHLRTPLTHIKWALSELAAGNYGQQLNLEQKKLTKDLLQNNERLVAFIESFMDTSRIESGKLMLEKKETDVVKMVQEIVLVMRDRAEQYYRITIEIMPLTEEIPFIEADEESLKRVFEAVLDNAIVYNKPGGKAYIKIEKDDTNVVVDITDTGIGIEKENLAQIGQKFFRSPLAKKHAAEGTGLGMFIAYHIIKLHQGTLNINSKVGKGTTVVISLPISKI